MAGDSALSAVLLLRSVNLCASLSEVDWFCTSWKETGFRSCNVLMLSEVFFYSKNDPTFFMYFLNSFCNFITGIS